MSETTKRKSPPNAAPNAKRKKGGNNGKWATPHQKVKTLHVERGSVEPGDVGIWVTCARSMEGRAAREMMELFDKYAKKMYGIPIPGEEGDEAGAEAGEDAINSNGDTKTAGADEIEDLVQREIASLKAPSKNKSRYFTRIRLNVECLLFSKTFPPIDPVAMAHQISVDVKRDAETAAVATDEAIENGSAVPITRSFRYLNRLTPIAASGRATEKGVREVAHKVLSPWFTLAPQPTATLDGKDGGEDSTATADAPPQKEEGSTEEKPAYTFAIRPSFRHHHELERRNVIDLVAALIDQNRHKVDLVNPDKVILIEIFRYTCGMSVVDGDWNDLRKYNLSELYNLQFKNEQPQNPAEATEAITTADEGKGADIVDVKDDEK